MDELDREEFYRLKKVSNKKQRDTAAQDAEILAQRQREMKQAKGDATVTAVEGEQDTTDVLGQEDEDVIF